ALAGFDAQELVVVRVDLQPDVVARLDAHDGELHVRARPQSGPIVVVLQGRVLDIDDVRVRAMVSEAHRCSCLVEGSTRRPGQPIVAAEFRRLPWLLLWVQACPKRPGFAAGTGHGAGQFSHAGNYSLAGDLCEPVPV